MADEWIDYDGTEDADDWGFAFDEDFGGASALDNILISSDIPKAGGGTLIPGLAIPELASINFDGSIPRERVSLQANNILLTVGKFIYLDENNNFYTSTEPSDTDISYQIIDKETSGSNIIFSVLKDGVVIQLSPIASSTSIWIVQEAWDDRDNGNSGWVISSEGNSIFNNVAVRGQIEATSGSFGDWTIGSYNSYEGLYFSYNSVGTTIESAVGPLDLYLKADTAFGNYSWSINSYEDADSRMMVLKNLDNSTLNQPIFYVTSAGAIYSSSSGTFNGSLFSYGAELSLGSTTQLSAPDVYTSTFSTANYVVVGSAGRLRRYTSSSRRYKEDIEIVNDVSLDPYKILDIGVYQYRFAPWYLDPEDSRSGELVVGFIAEDVEENYPVASNFDEETGLVESWDVKYIVPPMLQIIKDQQEKINNLEERLAILEG